MPYNMQQRQSVQNPPRSLVHNIFITSPQSMRNHNNYYIHIASDRNLKTLQFLGLCTLMSRSVCLSSSIDVSLCNMLRLCDLNEVICKLFIDFEAIKQNFTSLNIQSTIIHDVMLCD